MGWLDHGRLGFNYRLSDVAAALGVAQVEKLDALLAERARVAGAYAEALARSAGTRGEGDPDGLVLPAPTAARSGAAGSSTRSASRGRRPRRA